MTLLRKIRPTTSHFGATDISFDALNLSACEVLSFSTSSHGESNEAASAADADVSEYDALDLLLQHSSIVVVVLKSRGVILSFPQVCL